MRTVGFVMGAALAALALGAVGQAQPPASAPNAASAEAADPKAVVAEVRRIVAANYVLPEVRPKLDAALAKSLAEGRYDTRDPMELAQRINRDLEAVAHDKHLGLSFDPREAARLAAAPPESGSDDAPPSPEEIRRAEMRNHGLVEMKVLPGNIRYLDMDGFVWVGPKSAAAYDNAIRFLQGGEAVIIDLRRNGGGSPDAVQYLISHFLPPDRPIVTFYMGSSPPEPRRSLVKLPAGRLVGKPLYVLTSGRSASAAEEFAGHVAGFRIGELIGETTAGAGFRNQFFAVPGGFLLSVSVGRAVLASTGKDWEGVGHAPTTRVDPSKALEVAQAHALTRLAAAAPAPERARYEARARLLLAQVEPVATALPLSAYAGTFGERTISVEDGRIYLQRSNGPKLLMVPVGPNLFAFDADPLTRVEYAVAGAEATGFELIRSDGSRVTATRSP